MNHEITEEQAHLLIGAAWLGYFGCFVVIAGCLIAPLFVPDYDWVADTISDAAAGEWEIIMDVALYGFAAGLIATALGCAHAHPGGRPWSAGVAVLALLAALVVVIGARNEYGDGDSSGVVLHTEIVYALGALMLALPLLMAPGAEARHPGVRKVLLGLAVLWGVAAPIFFFLPTDVDGLYERGLGLVACGIVLALCRILHARGRAA
jgi:hypothetical protein